MPNVFRNVYREWSSDELAAINHLKETAQVLWDEFDAAGELPNADKRMIALAKTNLEQSVMWAVKAVTG